MKSAIMKAKFSQQIAHPQVTKGGIDSVARIVRTGEEEGHP
jgi:hypothetical protein